MEWKMSGRIVTAADFARAGLRGGRRLAVAAAVWWQSSQTQSQLTESLTAAERARESLASDLQNLQKTAGTAADLKKQAADAEKALSDASAARASAQNELADLTKQISDAKLAISGAQEEASARDARSAGRRRQAQGRKRPRRGAAEPGSGPRGRADPPAGRGRRGAPGSRPRPRPRPRPRKSSSRPCRARSTRRPPNSTPFRLRFAPRSRNRIRRRTSPNP